jgi:hypothetical protein
MILATRLATMSLALHFALLAQGQSSGGFIQSAIEHRWNDNGKAGEFTYLEYWHNRNLDKSGQAITDESAKFESISFGGEPYLRMIEKNGEPLLGRDADLEEQSYDASIAGNRNRDMQQRISEIVSRNASFGFNLDLIPIYFHSTLIGLTKVNGRDAFELLCKPSANIKPKSKADATGTDFNARVWIDANDLEFLRVQAELLKEHDHMLPGTTATMNWAPVDGVWLPQQTIIRGTAKDHRSIVNFETEYRFSDYRKFHSNSRIIGAAIPVAPTDRSN